MLLLLPERLRRWPASPSASGVRPTGQLQVFQLSFLALLRSRRVSFLSTCSVQPFGRVERPTMAFADFSGFIVRAFRPD
jgi:hypothetical protein